LITLVLGSIFLGEKFTIPSIIGAIVALGGLFLIANLPNEISFLVVGIVIFMRFLYAMQSFLVKKSGQKIRGISFTFWRILIMTTFLFVTTLVTGTLNVPALPILLFLFGSQIFGAYLGRVCYFEAHKYLGIGHINLLTLAQPVILLFGAWLLLNEAMPAQKLIGAGILLFGLALIVLEKSGLKKKFSLLRIFATLRGKRNDIENPIDLS
jgi:drug/metabolite transporter (DMT)-like permease